MEPWDDEWCEGEWLWEERMLTRALRWTQQISWSSFSAFLIRQSHRLVPLGSGLRRLVLPTN